MGPDATARQELRLAPIIVTEISVFVAAYATVNVQLFSFRIWFVSIALASIWNLCTNFAFLDPWRNTLNFGVCVVGFTMFMKLVEMTFMRERPKYDGQVACSEPSLLCKRCFINTLSYISDVRCLHWENDRPCPVPQDSRGDASHLQFYTHTFLRFLKHLFIYDTLHTFIESIGTLGTPQGDTIYRRRFTITKNLEIPVVHPAIPAVWITFMVGLVVCHSMTAAHYLCTLLTAPFACLPPSISPYSLPASILKKEWPPLFDNPLVATSLRDFWSRRWHATFRRNFWVVGARPGAFVGGSIASLVGNMVETVIPSGQLTSAGFGAGKPLRLTDEAKVLGARLGGVMGVFLMSGLLHDFGMWGMGQGMDFRHVTGYFLIQGIGLIVESALGTGKSGKGSNKQGVHNANASVGTSNDHTTVRSKQEQRPSNMFKNYLATLWVFMWVVVPATMMVEAWLGRGLSGMVLWPHSLSPTRWIFKLWNHFAFDEPILYTL
ncbi:membrane bound O-acyl transferase family protein [Rhizoctonia solani AG-3 Rhs1AP]|uniref:Membrane bound O-acyl transferase family protein n=2 Tax=Rhizoctonia solani AG-3 TaxID=1086053 RepID=A0A074RY37_9AGAM|nr:membrane bound O-acyl transferase family protein [Rhizoctonia solani AG-3 Rhs1AP]KEP51899.1 membrane bound O-acyl transferase family protein [Rhizoctonia solani 123E]